MREEEKKRGENFGGIARNPSIFITSLFHFVASEIKSLDTYTTENICTYLFYRIPNIKLLNLKRYIY